MRPSMRVHVRLDVRTTAARSAPHGRPVTESSFRHAGRARRPAEHVRTALVTGARARMHAPRTLLLFSSPPAEAEEYVGTVVVR